jgi:hypothetical protein
MSAKIEEQLTEEQRIAQERDAYQLRMKAIFKKNYASPVPKAGPRLISFNRNEHFTFGTGDPMRDYTRRADKEKLNPVNVFFGQAKLFFSELAFLNLYYDVDQHKSAYFVYVGGALGTHINPLAFMFPKLTFVLYDDRPYHDKVLDSKIEGNPPNIQLKSKLFGDDDVKEWRQRQERGKHVFLVVDIRNTAYTKIAAPRRDQAAFMKNEQLVIDDHLLQQQWVETIKPTKSLLKFRLPYNEQFVPNEFKQFNYLDGIVFRQQFASPSSSETRLVPSDPDADGIYPKRNWDIAIYEKMLSSHNRELRETAKFINPLANLDPKIGIGEPIAEKIGLLNDYDSTAATIIILDYMTKFGIQPAYPAFYALAKQLFISIGNSIVNHYNLRGRRAGGFFIDEDGKESGEREGEGEGEEEKEEEE